MFMPQTEGGIFYFAGQEITAFSFAKIWQDFWPDLKISFSTGLEIEEFGYLGHGQDGRGFKLAAVNFP